MATFTVTTSADAGAGSLRAAVAAANASAGTDVVGFDAAVFDGGPEDLLRLTSGQIEITDGLAITGGPAGVTITGDANGDDVTLVGGITDVEASLAGDDRLDDNSRIFDATAALTLDGLTLTGGRTTADFENGGAVRGRTVTLMNSTISGNSTTGDSSEGGGVSGYRVSLTKSSVSGNGTAGEDSDGGGIYGGYRGYTGDYGGYGGVTLTNSTVSDNSTVGIYSEGGGIWSGHAALTNSTISGNSTAGDDSNGGGLYGSNVVRLSNSTISGNSTSGDNSEGGGVYGVYGGVTLTNSLVLGNATIFAGADGDEVEGELTLTDGNIVGGNLFYGDAEVGDVAAADVFAATTEIAPGVLAGVLADNGGPTRTILIAADGPAADAGGATVLPTDQRGLERVSGASVDLGAVELGADPAEPGSLIVTTALDVVANDGLTSLREAVFFANLEQRTDTITFDASVFDGEARDVIRLTSGQITVTEALILDGGAGGVTITGDANGDDVTLAGGITDMDASLEGENRLDDNSRIFDATADLTLDDLTLTGGHAAGAGGAVNSSTTVTLQGSVISGNRTDDEYSDYGRHDGGGVYTSGILSVQDSTISGNSAGGAGGGLAGQTIHVTNSVISDNSTRSVQEGGGGLRGAYVIVENSTIESNSVWAGGGGGISAGDIRVIGGVIRNNRSEDGGGGGIRSTGDTYVSDSLLSGNDSADSYGSGSAGGGINSDGALTVLRSTVSDNIARGFGGGIFGLSSIVLENSTVSGNALGLGFDIASGGGVFGRADVTVTQSTVSGNTVVGTYYGYGYSGGGGIVAQSVALANSIVLGNATYETGLADDVRGTLILTGGNILGGNLFVGDDDVGDVSAAEVFAATIEITPSVFAGALADNGGPTPTVAIRTDGPATGAADPTTPLAIDQRGFSRDAAPDLGAFEAGAEDGLQLFGGPEADALVGGEGDDRIWGCGGDDTLRGLAGDDLLRGGNGSDRLEGGVGADLLRGGKGRDQIGGDAGEDVILGGWGRDHIDGGAGDDLLSGGKGRDVFVFGPDPGADTIVDFDANPHWGQDRVDLRALGISAASFSSDVTIEQIDDDTQITLQGGGSILCTGIDGEGVAVIDQSDFLLLA